MELNTISQTYLLPANSPALGKALSVLKALGLKHESPRELSQLGVDTLLRVEVTMPVIPVVHYFALHDLRQELITKRAERLSRPSHREAREGSYGAIAAEYPDDFFSTAAELKLAAAITDLVVREHIIRHFAAQEIVVHKIALSKPANEVLTAPRFFQQDHWYALVEEARPVVADLATLLGAI